MDKNFEEKFKKILDFVSQSNLDSPNKPAKPHVKRVGEFLFSKGFSDEVVVAGLLHDMLEWSSVTEKELTEKFDKEILEIIKANSKNWEIVDINLRRMDTINRCLLVGDTAMAVKIADVIDSVRHYFLIGNEKELERFLIYARSLKENLSDTLKSTLEEDLDEILKIKSEI